jgi:hypothetical protein
MANTTEEEIVICTDCALIIANDDDSGAADGEHTRSELSKRWAGYWLVVTSDIPGTGPMQARFGGDCEGCGAEDSATHNAVAEPIV